MKAIALHRCSRAKGPAAFLLALAVLGAGRHVVAQTILFEWRGVSQGITINDEFGRSMAGIGDVDRDGVPDVAIGAPSTHVGALQYAGRLYVFSGRDGQLLHMLDGQQAYDSLAWSLATPGDMDRDGHADILVLSISAGWQLVSGRTGTVIRSYPGYHSATGVGDVDGDGWPDMLFGTCSSQPVAGFVDLVSGRTGTVLYRFQGTYPYQNFCATAAAGDVNGDGVPDLLVSAVGSSIGFTAQDGIWVYSGRTGSLLFRVPPPGGTNTFGFPATGAGDLDGDGLDDVILSDQSFSHSPNYSRVLAYSGPTGAPLFTLTAPPPFFWIGASTSWVGDVDGDGYHDVLTGGGATGTVIFSGRDQSLLNHIPGSPGQSPSWCMGVGDINGDDFPDYLVRPFWDYVAGVIAVRLYSGAPQGVISRGLGCPDSRGVTPRIGCTYVPARGGPFSVNLTRARTGAGALLVLGLSDTAWSGGNLPYDLSSLGMPGCFLRTSLDATAFTLTSGPAGRGRASLPMVIPNHPLLTGRSFFTQWLVLDTPGLPAPASTTRALQVTIQ